jgi:hypothetical protein
MDKPAAKGKQGNNKNIRQDITRPYFRQGSNLVLWEYSF